VYLNATFQGPDPGSRPHPAHLPPATGNPLSGEATTTAGTAPPRSSRLWTWPPAR
jgi:hypothetical protein